jgi:hypothetical protein
MECLPQEEKGYRFQNPAGIQAVCDCVSGYQGMYCNETVPLDGPSSVAVAESGSSRLSSRGFAGLWLGSLLLAMYACM